MRVVICGGGVIGACTAYFLSRRGTDVTVADSPFCGTGKTACCEFLTGFMQGFLDAGPLTQNTRVHKAECRAKGDSRCTYKFNYDL